MKLEFQKEDTCWGVYNRKGDRLGQIYFDSDWGCNVWEQNEGFVVVGLSLAQIVQFLKQKYGDEKKRGNKKISKKN